jgi:UDP-N-acetylglucosamine--N-acetylmuramyl-(pentapeptide) pyrophosphoryl-undecaprenol N-acetylglucosamine transferase
MPKSGGEIVHVGNPVRPEFVALRERPYQAPAADRPFRLLVTGGSQGARVFSEVVPAALAGLDEHLRSRIQVDQQCRPEDLAEVQTAFARLGIKADLRAFFDDIPERLGAAHLVICRSGASTAAEITVAGRPAIFVPYPHAADDHQRFNAAQIARAGAGWAVPQSEFSSSSLAARISALADQPQQLDAAAQAARAFGKPDAAHALADLVERHARAESRR